MKLKNTFALMVLLLQTTSLWGMENECQEKIVKIKKNIEYINNNIKVDENSKKVLILGQAGIGKSVLLNYLAEKRLTGKNGKLGLLSLEVDDLLIGAVLGYDITPQSLSPNRQTPKRAFDKARQRYTQGGLKSLQEYLQRWRIWAHAGLLSQVHSVDNIIRSLVDKVTLSRDKWEFTEITKRAKYL